MAIGAFYDALKETFKTATGTGGGFKSIPVTSSCFSALEYNESEKLLNMTFTDGRRYQIPGIEPIEVERWTQSESVGGYFNANVRGKY